MKKVLLVLPIAFIMANCNTTHNTASSGNSGTNGSTASTTSTDMNTGTSGSVSSSGSGSTSTDVGSATGNVSNGTSSTTSSGSSSSGASGSATMGSTGSTSGTSGSGTMGTSGSTTMSASGSGSTSSDGSSAGAMNVSGSATGMGNDNTSSGMHYSGSMTGNVYNGYDPHNYMQNPDKYKRPDELVKTGGWTYNTDWRRNTNYTADAGGQWQLVATPEVASSWIPDASKPESYASYWTDEAMTARYNARMTAANAMRDSLAMANNSGNYGTNTKGGDRNRNNGISGTGTTGSMGSGGSAAMSNNGTTGATIDDMSGGNGMTNGTMGNGNTNGAMGNGSTNGTMNNSSSAMSGNGNGNTNSYLTAINGNTFMMPRLNLYLDNGTFTGYTGCNDIMGRVTVNGNQLHFNDAVPSSNIQCMGGFDQSAFLDRLRRADSYDVVNNQIRIKQGDQVLMVLSKNSQ